MEYLDGGELFDRVATEELYLMMKQTVFKEAEYNKILASIFL